MKIAKIALICPSNLLYMPYVNNYLKIIESNNVAYEIINWDRFNIEDENDTLKYKDSKIGHQRNYLDYFKYKQFLIKVLKTKKYDKVIVFGIQLSYFLKRFLIQEYKGNYILDIRDHNQIINFFGIKKIVDNSNFTVISSPGYKDWLPMSNKYIVNHNTVIDCIEDLMEAKLKSNLNKINVSFIGAIRDYNINFDFINVLRNDENINMFYHGEGDINKDIEEHLKKNEIKNVLLTGRFNKEDEAYLYKKSDLINVLRFNDGINNKTALPNRLYNAILYGKPLLAFEGTYLAEQIKEYNLGLVISSFNNVEEKIKMYIKSFDIESFDNGRKKFFEKTISDNQYFKSQLNKFLGI
ncbi:hypothetical protein [Mesobacillus jeotgali]|uniref:hypothetical protein n=1 Tax=Mesobacillus jeotgali TaxID=129985 RepID=UPI0009A8925B|nr:hypothetical protein [Mesobacillus jeotgali]